MMREELRQLVDEVRQRQSEMDNVEVKAARGGTPKRLYDSLSAFAKRPERGVVLFALDQSRNFEIVGDAQKSGLKYYEIVSARVDGA